ncbi:glycoside hydrolase family 35 protein [Aestuariimicrobium ganziense]|uniref:glycoside hydrolase family 35 protein n=1 Tax=Aestuariimicrobium ganziense TaxID=2773677 RepID=UPI001942CE79|nr:beta-galactosidase [Aestuariimicrobium ganziense]
MTTIEPTDQGFQRHGEPHLIISGAVHYFRVHPDDWAHRLGLLAAMGCNTVETYVVWNFHAPDPDTIDFTGWRDLSRFLTLAQEAGLDAIVRPGPYVCAEWEAGGFPGWLLADPSMRLRVRDERYEAHVERWFDALIPVVAVHQADRGGNVVMVQVENEYGSFGDDTAHLEWLRDGLVARGITELLVTSDGPGHQWLSGGTVDGATPTVNFGSRTAEVVDMCGRELPGQPMMCMEFWHGWFDHWGEQHHTRDAAEAAGELDTMLSNRMSVNFYMGHGGTNFELWNGANHDGTRIQPTVTSYDYDAPISEDGRPTAKFHAFREVIAKHRDLPELVLPPEPARLLGRQLEFSALGSLQDTALWTREPEHDLPHPPTFEALGLHGGFVQLSRTVGLLDQEYPLRFHELHDRAHTYLDGEPLGSVNSWDESVATNLPGGRRDAALEVLVESLGRINFGPRLGEGKGVRGLWYGMRFLNGWQVRTWPLDRMGDDLAAETPATHRRLPLLGQVDLEVDEPGVGFIDTSGLGQGYCWVNGFLVGRYWSIGPGSTLHVPAGLWRGGTNRITILELENDKPVIGLADEPRL